MELFLGLEWDDIRKNGKILDDSARKITESAVRRVKLFPKNFMIFAIHATIGEHALITVPYLANQQFINLSVKEKYAEKLDIKYLYYYGFLLADWCKKNKRISCLTSVDLGGFRKFEIPIPCPGDAERSLEIQAEIVRGYWTYLPPLQPSLQPAKNNTTIIVTNSLLLMRMAPILSGYRWVM